MMRLPAARDLAMSQTDEKSGTSRILEAVVGRERKMMSLEKQVDTQREQLGKGKG
jgi:hypothetical protein